MRCCVGVLLLLCASSCHAVVVDPESRLAVLQGHSDGEHAFRTEGGVLLQVTSLTGKWTPVSATPGGKAVSNPVAERGDAWGLVFVQAENGQVYYGIDIGDGLTSWKTVSPGVPLPYDAGATVDVNSLTVLRDNTTVHLFAKTIETHPRLYWSHTNTTRVMPSFSDWSLVGGSDVHLQSAAAVAVNSFTHYIEIVSVMTDNRIYHTWQKSKTEFHSWKKFSHFLWRNDPVPQATPLLRSNSGKSIFEGRLEMFVYGKDGLIHHLAQTVCAKIMTPWSECTWGMYKKLDKHAVPTPLSTRTPLVVGNNAHGGIEIFTVDKSFHFWHMYQVEEGKSYQTWQEVGTPVYHSSPSLYRDLAGYWQAYAMDDQAGVREILQPRGMILKHEKGPVASGTPVTVIWSVPDDEATGADWIGIYRDGDPNDKYLDYSYVQGFQNPRHNAVPVGHITRRSVLGSGVYNYRYLVNRQFVSVLQQSLTIYNYTQGSNGSQLYRGLAVGLGKEAGHFEGCVDGGHHTVAVLHQAFTAFKGRKVIAGLQLFAVALKDLLTTLVACSETALAHQLEKFIMDLITCTTGDCVHFTIDLAKELYRVFYENVHEIYGDIRGAHTCFQYGLYEQGGINVGRVVAACLGV